MTDYVFIWIGLGVLGMIFNALADMRTFINIRDIVLYAGGILTGPFYLIWSFSYFVKPLYEKYKDVVIYKANGKD